MNTIATDRPANGLAGVALWTGLLPIVAVHCSYLISASLEFVPWCNPYWAECTSISATGRHGPAYYFFKATMIPAAMLLMLFWVLTYQWLRSFGDARHWKTRTIVVVGVIGAGCLIMYTTALGAPGEPYRLQRRIGVMVYFTFTYFAQLLLVRRLSLLGGRQLPREYLFKPLFSLCAIMMVIGLVSLFLNIFYDHYDRLEDAFEWIFALLVHCYFLVVYFSWRRTGFAAAFATRERAPLGPP